MNFEIMFYPPFLKHLAQVWDAIEKFEAAERVAKDAWRGREGWCTAEEAELILSGKDGARLKIIEED